MNTTIVGIATAIGEAGVAVIRVSGTNAIHEVAKVFKSKAPIKNALTHTVHYGYIFHPISGERVEEVLVTIMRAPRSFTTEDVVEINTHGGVISVKRVMDILLQLEILLAEPGEFTKRAFLNGRLDLSQAEGVIDLIRAKSDRAFSIAFKQLEGQLSLKINDLRAQLVKMLAHIEVNIDYPEHDVDSLTTNFIQNQSTQIMKNIECLLSSAEQGKILREGIMTAIIGRPNVGKSSLLNYISQQNRAIVTDIPGTTRDIVEQMVTIKGIPLNLLDTAGIRKTDDIVEKIGVSRSQEALAQSDLVLLVINSAEHLHPEDIQLLHDIREKQAIIILSKTDLPCKLNKHVFEKHISKKLVVSMSVKKDQGLDLLEQAITNLFFNGMLASDDLTYVSNVRHIALLNKAKRSLQDAYEAAIQGVPIDIIQIDIRLAWEQLGEIVGDTAHEALVDQIFSQFCLGK